MWQVLGVRRRRRRRRCLPSPPDKHKIDVVLVSPSKRTLQTATNIFKNTTKKLIAIDEITEYPQTVEYCNKRKNKSLLKELYPTVDFSFISEVSPYWNDDTEIEETEKEDRKSVV